MKLIPTLAVAAAICGLATQTSADDDGLYGAAAPEDAAFLRVISPSGVLPQTLLFGERRVTLEAQMGTRYGAISTANLEGIAAGSFHTLVMSDGMVQAHIEEPERAAASKVSLVLLNASQDEMRLVAPELGVTLVPAVLSHGAGLRAVNPLEASFAIERVSDGALVGSFDVSLSRGQNLTFLVTDTEARLIENSAGPVLRAN